MAAVDLEEIRKRYNFKQISVATWRNPGGSILPARGGPQPLVISAEAAGKPFIPSYKVRYPLPQPTDDEDAESEEDGESELEDSPLEALAAEADPEAPEGTGHPLDGGNPDDIVEIIDEASGRAQDPIVDGGDTVAAVTLVPLTDVIDPPETTLEPALGIDGGSLLDTPDEEDEAGCSQPSSQEEDDNAIAIPEHESISPPPAPSPPHIEAFDHDSDADDGLGIASDIPESFPISTEALPEVDTSALTDKPAAVEDLSDVPPSPAGDRSVHFAPGTPEPRPTVRKKKSAKGSKQKSRKRASAPIEDSPDDVVAIVDGATGEGPQPVSNGSHDAVVDEVMVVPDCESLPAELVVIPGGKETQDDSEPRPVNVDTEPVAEPHIVAVEATTSEGAGDLPHDGSEHIDVVPEADVPSPAIVDPIEPFKSKKRSSKASSKVKDKSEKKPSKSKVKDMIQSFEGRGVDVVPPPPLPDSDDLPKDFLPPPQPLVIELDSVETAEIVQEPDQDSGKVESSPAALVDIATTDDAHSPPDDASMLALDTGATSPLSDVVGSDLGATHNETDATVEQTSLHEVGSLREPHVEYDDLDLDHAHDGAEMTEPEPETVVEALSTSAEIDDWPRSGDELAGSHEDEPFAGYDERADIPSLIPDEDDQVPDLTREKGEETEMRQEDEIGTFTSEDGDEPQMLGYPVTETMDAGSAGNDDESTLVDEATAAVGLHNIAEPSAVNEPDGKEPIDDKPNLDRSIDEMTTPKDIAMDEPAVESLVGDDQPNKTHVEAQCDNDLVDGMIAEKTKTEATLDIPPCEPDLLVDETIEAWADAEDIDVPPLHRATEAGEPEPAPEEVKEAVIDVADKVQTEGEPASLEEEPIDRNVGGTFEEPGNDPLPGAAIESPLINPIAPPSPTLSKGGSYKHRADHWQRKHDTKRMSSEAKPEKASPSKRNSGHSREEPRSADRPHRSRRHSQPTEDETERRRRREARKAEESARIREEERKMAEEDEARRIRHEARRARRKAAAEEEAEVMRQKAEAIAYQEAEARRRRHEERERGSETARPRRVRRESVTKAPLLFRTSSDLPSERRREKESARGSRNDDRPMSKRSSSPAPPRAEESLGGPNEHSASAPAEAGPASSNGTKSSHRHRETTDGERLRSSRRESERSSRRPAMEERPRSFFGSLMRRL
ncbi:hypothetical protein LTR91_020822 [Friedmanniomyces endolithicus]|uniref:Uncharacterized protein n=1 Tax=Friedmanniomyces endolithicus TaxID=329885 RepID=A0AAN6FDU1_9PEZI|nr:hypothetical protein LTR82_013236 [Friedmanniomyces endolithicus]KAK0959512.1 hypothetical protein LTR91_020822 [Friedmanniomyces endolithicus]KAK0981006.1 hypothetical protein LTR54_015138 [Friedmanniomyces endolithicus]